MAPRVRGEHRNTPAEQAAWVEQHFGIGPPPQTPPAVAQLARDFPDDPFAEPEKARAAIAAAEAAGLRLGRGVRVPRATPPPSAD